MSSFLSPNSLFKPDTLQVQSVAIRRLDAFFDGFEEQVREPRVFLKIDTQGFDVEVLRGASNNVAKILGLQSEISVEPLYEGAPHYTEALEYYESLGFALMNLSVVNRTESGGILEYDCLMARRDRDSE